MSSTSMAAARACLASAVDVGPPNSSASKIGDRVASTTLWAWKSSPPTEQGFLYRYF